MAGYHDAHLTPDPGRTVVWRAIARYLSSRIPRDAAVLELGAGYCDWINQVDARRRVAVDLWPELPRYAATGVEAMVMDLTTGLASLSAGGFDAVLASNVLEHFAPDAAAGVVAQVCRLLKPGGRFVIVQPNFRIAWRRYFDDYTHRAVFTDVSLPALLRANGLRVDEVQPRFVPYSMQGSRVPASEWLVTAYLHSPIRPWAGQMLVVATKP